MTGTPYKLVFKPIILKKLIIESGIVQSELAKAARCSRATINVAINRGWLPTEVPDFQSIVERYISANDPAREWLREQGYTVSDIWKPLGQKLRNKHPDDLGERTSAGMKLRGLVPGDPEAGECTEVQEMFTMKARKLFKIFQNPFGNNFDPEKDAFLSEDHRYIRMAMREAVDESGMIAVIGEVGSGKTAMRKMFIHDIKQDPKIRIISPRIVDKKKITDSSICDAIIMDLAGNDSKCPQRPERKARKVEELITKHAKDNIRLALVIEEAQDLCECPRVLKLFKRFNEIEVSGRKVLAIILIGQPELADILDENIHFEMREVIRRIQVAEIQGLNGALKAYLSHKFDVAGLKIHTVIDDKAIDALGRRLTIKDQGREISVAFPLTVNNYMIKAMNYTAAHGYERVTEDVVNKL